LKLKSKKMKIVVLDGFTLNPGDLSWETLKELGELVVYDRTAFDTDKVVQEISDATVVFTNKTPITKEVLSKVPTVKYIGVLATGYNVVDVKAANEQNIAVTNIPAYGTNAAAQFVMGLLLEICHHIGDHNHSVQKGDWTKSIDFCYWNSPLIELEGKTIGLIGFGKIGQATAKIAMAFGMNVLVHSRTVKKEFECSNLRFVSLDEVLSTSDVISLHCPLNEATENIICSKNISKMKDGVLLINTSRGGLVNEQDLANALNTDKIYAAALDVVSAEPMDKTNPLLTAKNCIITPHIAWATKEARQRLMNTAVGNLSSFLRGNPVNTVN
jgi:glycerate dehydrogenase